MQDRVILLNVICLSMELEYVEADEERNIKEDYLDS